MFSLWSWRIQESRIQTYFPAEVEESKNPRIRRSKHLLRNTTLSLSRIEKFKNPSLFSGEEIRRIEKFKYPSRFSGVDIQRNEQFKNPSRFLSIKSIYQTDFCWRGHPKNWKKLRIRACLLERGSGEFKNLRIQADFRERGPEESKSLRIRANFWRGDPKIEKFKNQSLSSGEGGPKNEKFWRVGVWNLFSYES